VTLGELNAMTPEAAQQELARCCGARRWATAVSARRPFHDADQLYRVADDVWWSLEGSDWLEAFSHHPRIGEPAAGWAKGEQSGASDASSDLLKKLARRNHEYERKFGHTFLISATGKSAGDMLANLDQRMGNDPVSELKVAAGEQARITRLRLEKLLSPSFESSRVL
jgi:2-oxo-4-hydroxy-4-carboxy-5-ureidoimidazoline decarboxylase